MSLMLRKKAQVVLDKFNMQNFHVTIGDDPKNLKIVTECGKPMADIHGIVFNRMSPTPDEVAYSVELLEDFLTTHKVQFDAYMKAKIALGKLTEVTMKDGDRHIWIDHHYSNEKPDTVFCIYQDGFLSVRLDSKGDVNKVWIREGTHHDVSLKDVDNFTTDPKKLISARKYNKDWDTYTKTEKKVNDMLQELSTCDI